MPAAQTVLIPHLCEFGEILRDENGKTMSTTKQQGLFLPNWAFSALVTILLFLAGSAAAYFHAQSSQAAQMAVFEERLRSMDERARVLEQTMATLKDRSDLRAQDFAEMKALLLELRNRTKP